MRVGSLEAMRWASLRSCAQNFSTSALVPERLSGGFVLAGCPVICWDELMKISQKLEYACRALAQLAKHHDGRTLTQLEDLAQREEVSGNFLVQILNDLRRAGLVESRRGRAGGYLLVKSAQAITLRQVVDAVDPSLLQCSALGGGESGAAVKAAWEKVSGAVNEALDDITLESIVVNPSGSMFYI